MPKAMRSDSDPAIEFEVVDARSPRAIEAMTAYFDELDATFHGGFDPGETLVHDAATFDAPDGAFVLVLVGESVAGCGGVLTLESNVAEIKRMWIAPDARGQGLAPRLLVELERLAAEMSRSVVRLDTNATLTTAIAMYERAGYHPIERYNDNPFAQRWFEKRLS